MTEASRVQKMLNEQNAWIDKLKSQVMRLELELVGYRVRNKQLEAALREIAEQIEKYDLPAEVVTWFVLQKARQALEEKDD